MSFCGLSVTIIFEKVIEPSPDQYCHDFRRGKYPFIYFGNVKFCFNKKVPE